MGSSVVSIRKVVVLPGAVGAEEPEDLAPGHVDADASDRVDVPPLGPECFRKLLVEMMLSILVAPHASFGIDVTWPGRPPAFRTRRRSSAGFHTGSPSDS